MTTSFQSVSGRTIEVPPRRVPPEVPWPDLRVPLAEVTEVLCGVRDRQLVRLRGEVAAAEAMRGPPEAVIRQAVEAARQELSEAEARVARSIELCGAAGEGFAEAMQGAPGPGRFWDWIDRLAALRRPIRRYADPPLLRVQRLLLEALPPCHRLPILAEVVVPSLEARVSDPCEAMMAAYLRTPEADLRVLERGMWVPADLDGIEDGLLRRFAEAYRSGVTGLAGFKRHSASHGAGKAALTWADLVTRPLPRLERQDLVALIAGPEAARRHDEGLVQSEINLHRLAALGAAMRELKPGAPQGGYLRASLATLPQGSWALAKLQRLPRAAVWPYITTHFDMVDRALGLAAPSPLEPRLEPLKALDHLALLPATPARYGDALERLARGGSKTQAARARALLARG